MRSGLRLLVGIFDLLIPPVCVLCGDALPLGLGQSVCAPCLKGLERTRPPWCPTCGKPFVSEVTLTGSPAHRCAECRERPPSFDRARSLGPMEGGLRDLVHLYKFENKTSISKALGAELGRLAREHYPDTLARAEARITYVPIHRERWRERGFDQAELLARRTAEWLGLPFVKTLRRRKTVPPQTGLPGRERRRNLQGVFEAIQPAAAEGGAFVLVDDVLTTGSTASACARALKSAGVASVEVLTVCHTALKGPRN